mmetsp:Transcript_9088/g.22572  ORF Transcript_9088/g.22572 Transcript_9088/m.22572 type:complete len:214 (+) Transcript_9088:784-1425(+)
MTPTALALWSPIERAIASPRKLCHTRAGVPSAAAGETRPPILSIRSFSCGVSGFWSCVRSCVTSLPLGSRRATIARESPAFATHIVSPRISAHTAVVPLTLASMCLPSALSTSTKAFLSAWAGALWISACSDRILGRFSITNWDAFSPCLPWPSKQPMRPCVVSPMYGYTVSARSWLILRVAPPGTGSMPATLFTATDEISARTSAGGSVSSL